MSRVLCGDVLAMLATLPDESVDCVVTSPPYWGLRDYGHAGQIGNENTPGYYVLRLTEVFRQVRRVLKPTGNCWVNLGDTYSSGGRGSYDTDDKLPARGQGLRPYSGLKEKDLCMIPARVAIALQDDGWYLRQDIVWSKPNPMPESVTDRCTKSHEYVFLLTKSAKYWYDADAIKEPANGWNDSRFHTGKTAEHQLGRSQSVRPSAPKGAFAGKTEAMADTGQNAFRAVTETRNKRSVWEISTKPYPEAHFATFPEELPRLCILAGCPMGGVVLDPFAGSGTTLAVALSLGRQYLGIELNPEYIPLIERRLSRVTPPLDLFTEEKVQSAPWEKNPSGGEGA